ncbi:MAG: mannosyltransferase [Flavobacteriales bacterium]|nr:MAG: mannosyltransferase [Flavobacteriales bacterium]
MNIGFDAKRAFLNFTGLGNYSRGLIEMLLKYHPENQYFLYTTKSVNNSQIEFLKNYSNHIVKTPSGLVEKQMKSAWRTFWLTKQLEKDRVDLFHGLSHEIPVGIQKTNIKSVVTIHDLIFMRFPENYPAIDRKIYLEKIKHACKNANRIISISQQTKREIVDFINIDEQKIDVVYQCCDVQFKRNASEEEKQSVQKKYGLTEDYILYVGTVEKRKNLLHIVKAISLLKNKSAKLVVVGRHTAYVKMVKEEINKLQLAERVQFIENADFADLPAIYQLANIFVYPSIFEGFGIPILEALHSEIPVITSKGGCFPEAGGANSIYINPENPEEIAKAIDRVMENSDLKKIMIEKGLEHARQFSEEKIASEITKVYQKALEK